MILFHGSCYPLYVLIIPNNMQKINHSSLRYCKWQKQKAKSTVLWFLMRPFCLFSRWPPPSTFSIEILGLCSFSVFIPAYFSHAMWAPPHSGPASKKGNFPMEQIRDTGGEPASFQHRHSNIITIVFTLVIVIGATLVKNIISWKFLPWNRTYTSQPFAPYIVNGLNIPQQITLFLIQMAFIAFTSS